MEEWQHYVYDHNECSYTYIMYMQLPKTVRLAIVFTAGMKS